MHGAKFFRFAPTRELGFVLLSYVAVIAMFYLSFQVITTRNVAGQFITFGILGITLLGIFVPSYWTLFIKRRTLASLGIKKDKLALSIILCIVLSFLQYWITLRTIELPSWQLLVPLMTMALAVGFFENVFFRGWMQLRFEECFGLIPAILLSAAFYSLYHIGYGMRIDEMSFLFLIGLIYSSIFRLTSSLFIVFPFLTPLGALFSQIKDGLVLPFEATYGFVDVIVLIVIGLIFLNRKAKKKNPVPQT